MPLSASGSRLAGPKHSSRLVTMALKLCRRVRGRAVCLATPAWRSGGQACSLLLAHRAHHVLPSLRNARGPTRELLSISLNPACSRGLCAAAGGPKPGSQAGQASQGGEGGREQGGGKQKSQAGDENMYDDDDPDPENMSTGQKVKTYATLAGMLGLLGLAGVCGYYIVQELFPSRMSPNAIFNRAFDALQANYDVESHFGKPLKAYGRDTNRHREGRRNFVEHEEYTDKLDGSKRVRVRFNVQGPYGNAIAFAEVSSAMNGDEWVYLMLQDAGTGHVFTLHDNRAALAAEAGAGSQEEREALRAMLGKGSSTS